LAAGATVAECPMAIVPIRRLFETHLTVRDLDRSIGFYRDTLGLEVAHVIPERGVGFFWVGAPGQGMLGLWAIGSAPLFMRLHIAFEVSLEHLITSVQRLRAAGLRPRSGQPGGDETIAEPVVLGWMPAASVYFDDPDGHSLEFISMLPDPPRPDVGFMPLSAWRRLQ
jgi:lactoylglutathione lyase